MRIRSSSALPSIPFLGRGLTPLLVVVLLATPLLCQAEPQYGRSRDGYAARSYDHGPLQDYHRYSLPPRPTDRQRQTNRGSGQRYDGRITRDRRLHRENQYNPSRNQAYESYRHRRDHGNARERGQFRDRRQSNSRPTPGYGGSVNNGIGIPRQSVPGFRSNAQRQNPDPRSSQYRNGTSGTLGYRSGSRSYRPSQSHSRGRPVIRGSRRR